MSNQIHSSDNRSQATATDAPKRTTGVGVWHVFRDLLSSCLRVPRSVYGKPTDDLSAYAQAIALYGADSQEAKLILERNVDSEYFRARAGVLQRCKSALIQYDSGKSSTLVENPISAGEYASVLFFQSQEITLLQPEFYVNSAVETYLSDIIHLARWAQPTLDKIDLFIRRNSNCAQDLHDQYRDLSRVVPRNINLHVVHCEAEDAGRFRYPSVLTEQGSFEFSQKEPTCDTKVYRLVAPEIHMFEWQQLKNRSNLIVVGEYDIKGEGEYSNEPLEAVKDL